jgi:hypothetical protein
VLPLEDGEVRLEAERPDLLRRGRQPTVRRAPAGAVRQRPPRQGWRCCALGQDAAAEARQTSHHLEEYVFSEQIDPSVGRMAAAAAAAQAAFLQWPERRAEALLERVAQAAAVLAEDLAAATVTETGIGNVADKTFKDRLSGHSGAAWSWMRRGMSRRATGPAEAAPRQGWRRPSAMARSWRRPSSS